MAFDRLKSKFHIFYKIFIAPPKRWKLPKKSRVLIYDVCGADALTPYLVAYKAEVIPLRGEFVNVPCLLSAVLRLSFWKGSPIQAYVDAFIRTVSPDLVVTFIDNSPGFYTISSRFFGIKTVFLQNGRRDDWLDRIQKPKKFHVDYMFFHNAAIGRYYQKFVSGKAFAIGSLKNNSVQKHLDGVSEGVLFISQFREKQVDDGPFLSLPSGESVSWEQFYSAEECVLRFLNKWCIGNNKLLRVTGCSSSNQDVERNFFGKYLDGCDWEYVPKSHLYGSYKLVEAAEFVVFIGSALGYESIGRGKKTVSFSCRGMNLKNTSSRFGWPADLPDNGPFWTNDRDERQFQRLMDYISTVSDEDWEKTRRRYASELMEFDPGNTRFIALLEALLQKADESNGAN